MLGGVRPAKRIAWRCESCSARSPMEHHVGMSFVQAGTLAPAHYVKQIRGQRIIRCTQGVSHTQMNTALCACGLSWKVSSKTGRGYNQTGGYGSVMTLAVGDRGSGFVAGPVSCRPRDRHLHRGLEFLAIYLYASLLGALTSPSKFT